VKNNLKERLVTWIGVISEENHGGKLLTKVEKNGVMWSKVDKIFYFGVLFLEREYGHIHR
jgi:hypothetical protein